MNLTKETQLLPAIAKDEHVTINGRGAKKVTQIDTIGGGLAGAGGLPANNGGTVSYPTATREIYTLTLNGNTVATVTIDYLDADHNYMSSWSVVRA